MGRQNDLLSGAFRLTMLAQDPFRKSHPLKGKVNHEREQESSLFYFSCVS